MDLDERLRHRYSGAQDGSWGRRPGRPGTWELDMTGVISRLGDVGPAECSVFLYANNPDTKQQASQGIYQHTHASFRSRFVIQTWDRKV